MPRNCLMAIIFIVSIPALSLAASGPMRIEAAGAAPGSAILELQADELVTMTPIPFRLLIRDAAGRPLSGAGVSCDLTMPSMPMPENRPRIVEGDGAYTGEMVLTCTMGEWLATCVAETADGQRRTMDFALGTARLK